MFKLLNILKKKYHLAVDYINHSKKIEDEILYAQIFNDTIKGSSWLLPDTSFSFSRGACNYTFAYILYRVLESDNPLNILEMGMGQTSKITTQYILNKNKEATLDIIEHSEDWFNIFKKNINMNERVNVHIPKLEIFEHNGFKNDKYENLEQYLNNKKYNLIIIDGPIGEKKTFPRSNILDLIPRYLDKDFVIILDDIQRPGEIYLLNKILEKLDLLSVEYKHTALHGTKSQSVIASKSLGHIIYY